MHYYGSGYGMGMGGSMDYGFSIFGLIFHIIGWIIVIALIIWVVRMIFGGGRRHRYRMWQMHSALSILDERFAKGEIDKQEYEEKKKSLLS